MENGKKSEIQIRSEEGKEKLKECIRNTVFFWSAIGYSSRELE